MARVELSAGPIEYTDTGGDGHPVVLLHGLLMTGSVWDDVVAAMPDELRIVRPTWPVGAHRLPMRPDADLSLRGHARLVGEFLEVLDLHDVTLVFSDWCAAQVLIAEGCDGHVAHVVFVSCETDDNYPPGVPGHTAALAARIPGGVFAALQAMRIRALRRLPVTFGSMSQRPVPAPKMDRWLHPARTNPDIRCDLRRYAGDTRNGRRALRDANVALARFSKSVLVVWAAEDRVMPQRSGRRLAAAFPNAEYTEIEDSGNLIQIDQPQALADVLTGFLRRQLGENLGGTDV